MRRSLAMAALLGMLSAGQVHAAPPAPLPRGARALPDGRYASPLGFRETIEWYRKALRGAGAYDVIGPVRTRDVTYARLVSRDQKNSWSAVHIVLADGKTTVYLLPAFDGESPRSDEN